MTHGPSSRRWWLIDLAGVLILTAVATLPFLTPHADLALQRCFYTPDAPHAWAHETDFLWRLLYRFGPWPALLTGVAALIVLTAGRWWPALARRRVQALYLILTLALGPGLLVNVIFKDHWGRPRPREVQELGGAWPYQTFPEHGVGGRGKSFPCGHSSMGYYFVAFYFLWRRRQSGRAAAALAVTAVYGTLIGTARMAAGGHFASDVAWSAVMTVGAAYLVYYVILRVPAAEERLEAGQAPPPLSRWVLAVTIPAALFAVAMGLLGTPSYSKLNATIPILEALPLILDVSRCDVEMVITDRPDRSILVEGQAQGFGWPGSKVRCTASNTLIRGRPTAILTVVPRGWFGELIGHVTITLPSKAVPVVSGQVRDGDVTVKTVAPTALPALDILIIDGACKVPPEAYGRLKRSPARNGTWIKLEPPTP